MIWLVESSVWLVYSRSSWSKFAWKLKKCQKFRILCKFFILVNNHNLFLHLTSLYTILKNIWPKINIFCFFNNPLSYRIQSFCGQILFLDDINNIHPTIKFTLEHSSPFNCGLKDEHGWCWCSRTKIFHSLTQNCTLKMEKSQQTFTENPQYVPTSIIFPPSTYFTCIQNCMNLQQTRT